MAENIYDLIMEGEESNAAARAQAMAAALRKEQTAGQLMQLHPLLRQMGTGMAQRADQQEGRMAQAGQLRSGNALRRAMMAEQQGFTSGENEKDRAFRAAEAAKGRALSRALAKERASQPGHGDVMAKAIDRKEMENDIETYSKRVEGTPGMLNDLQALLTASAQEDIPGVSSGYKVIPGFVEDMVLGDEELQTRQAARGVAGAYLKMRSGTAASDKEVERLMSELGMGPNASEKAFRQGVPRLIKNFRDEMALKWRSMRPEAQAEALRRGLLSPDDFPDVGGDSKPKAKVGVAPKMEQHAGHGAAPASPAVVDERIAPDGRTIQLLSDGSKRIKE